MPTYDARCDKCHKPFTYHSTVPNRHCVPACVHCGGDAHKVILTAPKGFVKGNFEAFKSTVDGSIISTERDLRNHNKRNNVVQIGEGYDESKVIAGDFGRKEAKPDKKDIAEDIRKSVQKLQDGYKPAPRGEADGNDHWN